MHGETLKLLSIPLKFGQF